MATLVIGDVDPSMWRLLNTVEWIRLSLELFTRIPPTSLASLREITTFTILKFALVLLTLIPPACWVARFPITTELLS